MYENFSVEWSMEEKHRETSVDEVLTAEAAAADEVLQGVQPAGSVVTVTETTAAPKLATDLRILVNGRPVTLKGKASYCFVDILDFYPFDVSQAHGERVIMQINGEQAEFTSILKAGDIIDLYWK